MTRKGFSLVEILLALALVAVAILGIVGAFIAGVRMMGRSNELTQATEEGRQVLERIKLNVAAGGLDYLPTGTYLFDGATPDPPQGAAPLVFPPDPYPGDGRYVIRVSGRELTTDLREVSVEVRWGETGRTLLVTRMHR
ncbi:MAG: prepilin-type N-terminal cleavage/methylation domain-containing protein [Candidatus Eremiobacteraeota bacterium]|nr:prepilin-type N-terminal cleavage/methylation domain-containing protein [Candidatus Eremiobacteraeota bacterium]